ncbi:MAG: caspase family protein [Cyclobacteriaceae bacterium]|nr:caspase family protein [Cyclobacteriaceae bacterium]
MQRYIIIALLLIQWPAIAQDVYITPFKKFSSGLKEISSISFSSDSKLIAMNDTKGNLVIKNMDFNATVFQVPNTGIMYHEFIDTNTRFITLDKLGKLTIYNTADYSVVTTSNFSSAVKNACLDPNLQYLTVLNKENQIEMFDIKANMTFGRIPPTPELKNCAFIGFDRFGQQLAAISKTGDSYTWNPLNQKFLRELKLKSGEFANSSSVIYSASTNSGGDRFMIGMQEAFIPKGGFQGRNQLERKNMMLAYDWISGQEQKRIPLRYRVDGMALGPGPGHVAYYSEDSRTINLLNIEKSEVGSSVAVDEKPTSISLSDDNQFLAVGTVAGNINLFEVVRNDPPEIKISKPGLTRGYGDQVISESKLMVEGSITGNDKVSKVFVNGEPANFEAGKDFNLEVPLVKGKNKITVSVQNTASVITDKDFYVTCEPSSGKTVVAKPKAGTRLALVIGNSAYSSAAKLKNAKNDATAMTTELQALGFEVMKVYDGTYEQMKNAIYSFGDRIQSSEVCIFFYAGHGLEVDGSNYIVPVDADIQSALDVKLKALPLTGIIKTMEFANEEGLNMIILDACRNNPFPTGKRSSGSGLARVQAPSGTLIAYATDPGSVASDGDKANGLYTGELVKQLRVSQRIEDVFMNTRNAVEKASNGSQRPWEEARLRGVFYLK